MTYTLRAVDLFNKGGFQDGDIFRDWFNDYCFNHPLREHRCGSYVEAKTRDYPQFLFDIVKTKLVPLIPFDLTLEIVSTVHNNIRCFVVDGQSIDMCYHDILILFGDIETTITEHELKELVDQRFVNGVYR